MANIKLNSALPNLFDFATSELSQDAFLLWLLNWANPFDTKKVLLTKEQQRLHEAAQEFVRMLINERDEVLHISSVKCYKQKYHIDVLAVVNEKYAIIIEDKTNTKEHGKQIRQYLKALKADSTFSKLTHRCVYYKSGNESQNSLDTLKSYYTTAKIPLKLVLRQEMIDTLSPFITDIKNPIFVDYLNHIQEIEELTNSYCTLPADKWKDEAWEGFFMMLENKLEIGKKCNWGVDYYHKDFVLPQISIGDGIYLYLCLDKYRNLCIKANSEKKCSPKQGWKEVVKIMKEEIKIDGLELYPKEVQTAKDAKLIEIKRFDKKRKMFISKTLPFTAQPEIVNQLDILQNLLIKAASKLK